MRDGRQGGSGLCKSIFILPGLKGRGGYFAWTQRLSFLTADLRDTSCQFKFMSRLPAVIFLLCFGKEMGDGIFLSLSCIGRLKIKGEQALSILNQTQFYLRNYSHVSCNDDNRAKITNLFAVSWESKPK
jgi:hypothetical protein